MMNGKVLVTGISGFIARHCALAFLQAGYEVRGTVRSAARGEQVKATLAAHADTSGLEFVEADLMSDRGWDEAVRGCVAIAHLASPFPLANPHNEDEIIRPAVDGTIRVLEAALRNRVPRFVQTSSFSAIVAGHPASRTAPFTEDDWTMVDAPGVSAYDKSKTLSEMAAREFIARKGGAIRYSSVNPGLVVGPLLDREFGTSVDIVRKMMRGRYPLVPRMCHVVVDVRDVARMHVLAVERDLPSGGRYLACADVLWFDEFAMALRQALGEKANRVSARVAPDWVIRLLAYVDAGAAAAIPHLGIARKVDTSRTRAELGIEFIPAREALAATANGLIHHDLA